MTAVGHLLTRPRDLACRCMGYETPELFRMWQRRARPTIARLLRRGRPVDVARMQRVLSLMRAIDRGAPEAFAPANWACSHHLVDCPFHGRRTPLSAVDPSPEAAWDSR